MKWIGMRRSSGLVALLAAWCCTTTGYGWGPEGHRITGAIAEQHLAAATKQRIRELLGDQSLADVANWADEVRSQEAHEWTRPLHYVNVPRTATRVDMQRDCETGQCVIGAIQHFSEILADQTRSRTERAEALKFIVHFVGDIHQPMHVSYADDRGGNLITVTFMGDSNTNLHRVWDSGLLLERMDRNWARLAEELARRISERDAARWGSQLNAVEWANESLAVTRRIYDDLPRSGRLERDYYERHIDTVLERLAMSGVRMGALLNELLGGEQPVRTSTDDDQPEQAEGEPEKGDPAGMLSLVEGQPCGREDGVSIFIRNTHERSAIEVVVRQSWDDGERTESTDRRFVLQPGAGGQRRLGCTRQAVGVQVREFSWEIIEASFR